MFAWPIFFPKRIRLNAPHGAEARAYSTLDDNDWYEAQELKKRVEVLEHRCKILSRILNVKWDEEETPLTKQIIQHGAPQEAFQAMIGFIRIAMEQDDRRFSRGAGKLWAHYVSRFGGKSPGSYARIKQLASDDGCTMETFNVALEIRTT